MIHFLSTPPLVEPVSLAEFKMHLRLEHDTEDTALGALLQMAREDVEMQTGLALIIQSWRIAGDIFPVSGIIHLNRYPVSAINSVKVFDRNGVDQPLSSQQWQLMRARRPAILDLGQLDGSLDATNGFEIEFTAGYGESGVDVHDNLKRAILLLASHLYEVRAGGNVNGSVASWPVGYDRLIEPFRLKRL